MKHDVIPPSEHVSLIGQNWTLGETTSYKNNKTLSQFKVLENEHSGNKLWLFDLSVQKKSQQPTQCPQEARGSKRQQIWCCAKSNVNQCILLGFSS